MRQLKVLLLTLAICWGAPTQGLASFLPDLYNWGGPTLLEMLQSKTQGKVTVGKISGNPLTGLIFKDLNVAAPDGRPILTAAQLEVRLSLRSIPALKLEVASLVLTEPHLYLSREAAGPWNVESLRPVPPSPAAPAPPPGRLEKFLLREIDLADIRVEKGEIILTRGGATTAFAELALRADLDLFDLNQPELRLKVNAADLQVTTPKGRLEFDTRLAYGRGLATIDRLALKLAGREVLSLEGEVCRPLTQLTCKITGQWGLLPGSLLHEFWPRWPAPWDLAGKFSFSSTPQGAELETQGGIGRASFSLKGTLDARAQPAAFALEGDLRDLSTAQLSEVQGINPGQMQGLTPVNGHLSLKGTGLPWNPAALQVDLKLAPFQYREARVEQVQLHLQGDARRQQLNLRVGGNFGSLALDSQGRLLPLAGSQGLSGELTLTTKEFQPDLLGWRRYPGTAVTARFTGNFRLPPSLSPDQLQLAGQLNASGRLGKEPVREVNARFGLEGRKLTISRADVQMAGVEAGLKGTITEAGLDVAFEASVAGSRNLPLPPGPSFASLQAQGTVKGPWRALQWNLAANLRKAAYQGTTLESANLTANLTGWPPVSGTLLFQGTQLQTAAGGFTRVSLTAQGAAGRWEFQGAATSPQQPRAALAGAIDLRSRPLVVSVSQVSWQSEKLKLKNRAPFQVRLLPGWEVSPAAFQIDGGTVTFQGMARGQEVSGSLEIQNLDAALLKPAGLEAQGKLSGKLTLGGTPQAPVLDGRLALSGGRLREFTLQTLQTTLNYRDGQLQVAGFLEEGVSHARLTWKGTLPVHLTFLPPKFSLGEQGLEVRIQSEKLNLAILTTVSKEVQSAGGQVEIMVLAKGSLRQPQVSGYIRWGAGCLQIRPAGTPFQLAAGEIRLQGSKITIPGLTLTSDGTATLTGDVNLSGAPKVTARVQLNNFQAMNRGGNEIWSNGTVDLTGPLTALKATGHLVVPKAQLRPTLFRSGLDPDIVLLPVKLPSRHEASAPSIYDDMSIDVSLESAGNVWLKDPKGKVEMRASMRALKKPGRKLAMGGTIQAIQGTVDVNDNAFKVERGSLALPGVPGKPILIDAKATHEIDEVTLVLTVNGTLTNPLIRLESEPSLPPADVLSYLAFGAPAATLTKEQYLALGAQQLGVLGGVTPGKLNDLLGSTIPFLSGGLSVKSGTVGGRPTVGVAKEITKNVSVTYGRSMNEERGQYENQVGVQYKFNKNLSVESQIGPRNSGADVLFNYDF